MASQTSIQLIETALFCPTPFPLSYTDPDQKWLIRSHLLSLLQNFPSFSPSFDNFTHNDGTTMILLNAKGDIQTSRSSPPISLTIWLHENYPHMAPIVLISPNSIHLIHRDHPFVDTSGSTKTPYLQSWLFPKSNLFDLVRNLVNLFTHNHPFFHNPNFSTLSHPFLASKMEAMDRLSCTLHYDLIALSAETEEEKEALSAIQVEMGKRVDITTSMIKRLEHEKTNLKRRVEELTEDRDVLVNWLKVHGNKKCDHEIEDLFEGEDEESRIVLDLLAKDLAIDDLIYALDKAVEQGVVPFGTYIRQVRVLAREQFEHRAKVVQLRGSQMLNRPG